MSNTPPPRQRKSQFPSSMMAPAPSKAETRVYSERKEKKEQTKKKAPTESPVRKSPSSPAPVKERKKNTKESSKKARKSASATKNNSKDRLVVKESPSRDKHKPILYKMFMVNFKPSSAEGRGSDEIERGSPVSMEMKTTQLRKESIEQNYSQSSEDEKKTKKNSRVTKHKKSGITAKHSRLKAKDVPIYIEERKTGNKKHSNVKRNSRLEKGEEKPDKIEKNSNEKTTKDSNETKEDADVEKKKAELALAEKKARKEWESRVKKLQEKIKRKTSKLGESASAANLANEDAKLNEVLYPKGSVPPSTRTALVLTALAHPDLEKTAAEPTLILYCPSTDLNENKDNDGHIFVSNSQAKTTMPFWMDPELIKMESDSTANAKPENLTAMSLNAEALLNALSGTLNLLESQPSPKYDEFHHISELEYRDEEYFNPDIIFSNSLRSMMALNEDVKDSVEKPEKKEKYQPVPLNITLPTVQSVYSLSVDKTVLKDLIITQAPFKESGKRLNSRT